MDLCDLVNNSVPSSGGSWNFSNKENPGYTNVLKGVLVEIKICPKYKFGTKEIDFTSNGKPKMGARLVFMLEDGSEVGWFITPGFIKKDGSDRRTKAGKALCDAAVAAGLVPTSYKGVPADKLMGKWLEITTPEPPEGFTYSAQNPRPFKVVVLGDAPGVETRGVVQWDPSSEEQQQPAVSNNGPVVSAPAQFQQQMAQQFASSMRVNPQVQQMVNQQPATVYDAEIPF